LSKSTVTTTLSKFFIVILIWKEYILLNENHVLNITIIISSIYTYFNNNNYNNNNNNYNNNNNNKLTIFREYAIRTHENLVLIKLYLTALNLSANSLSCYDNQFFCFKELHIFIISTLF
jgi:hypothetical protein